MRETSAGTRAVRRASDSRVPHEWLLRRKIPVKVLLILSLTQTR